MFAMNTYMLQTRIENSNLFLRRLLLPSPSVLSIHVTLQKETAIEKEMIKFTAEKNIALYNLSVAQLWLANFVLSPPGLITKGGFFVFILDSHFKGHLHSLFRILNPHKSRVFIWEQIHSEFPIAIIRELGLISPGFIQKNKNLE